MKKLVLFFLLNFIISPSIFAQVKSQDSSLTKGGSEGIQLEKKRIPNYISPDQSVKRVIQDSSMKSKSKNIHSGNGSSVGIVDKDFKEKVFQIDLSYGWATNSDSSVFSDVKGVKSLVLSEKHPDLYLNYLLRSNEKLNGFTISFDNESQVEFIILEITKEGRKSLPFTSVLPGGDRTDLKIEFYPHNKDSNLLLSFYKKDIGSFILNNIKLMED
jgi:hypothetical protein